MATLPRRTYARRSLTLGRWRRRRIVALRHARESEYTWFIGLALLCVGLFFGTAKDAVPLASFAVPVIVGGLALSVPRLLWLFLIAGATLVASALVADFEALRVGSIVVIVVVAAIMLWNARSRSNLGVAGTRGEAMLIDLRDRLQSQGTLPELPEAWYADAVTRSAGGSSFAGDFMVSARTHNGAVLEVALVDVSGKGLNAGTRALLLSGAFGGLLGSLPPVEFLPAANAYLQRQQWGEGFATAIHLALDLRSGAFELRSAGHPPAVQLYAGSGRWAALASEGPILGLMDHAEFTMCGGQLGVGDAMLLYTDGLVETPLRDLSLGIDKLMGEAERLVARGFDRGAARLVNRIASENDDRALLLLHRRVP